MPVEIGQLGRGASDYAPLKFLQLRLRGGLIAMMNDYIETPEGSRVRWLRPIEMQKRVELEQWQIRVPGVAYIDQWFPPGPPDAA